MCFIKGSRTVNLPHAVFVTKFGLLYKYPEKTSNTVELCWFPLVVKACVCDS